MPGDGRRGRRDNGLDAASYVPLVDVDPRVGEHLLDVLGSAGVPAYLEPSADVEPYTRALSLPSPPTDRLWVDRDQRGEARRIVDAETPHGPRPRPPGGDDEPSHGLADLDEERAWREIVAAWSAPAAPRPPHDPSPDRGPDSRADPRSCDPSGARCGDRAGDHDRLDERRRETQQHPGDDRDRAPAAGDDPAPLGRALPTPEDLDAAAVQAAATSAADDELTVDGAPAVDEEHYDPPPPPPVPRPSRTTILAVLLIALGILLIAAPGVAGMDDRTGLTFGVAAVLGGAALLVLRLRESRGDDGPDDGAVV
jgi:hypothetical protein